MLRMTTSGADDLRICNGGMRRFQSHENTIGERPTPRIGSPVEEAFSIVSRSCGGTRIHDNMHNMQCNGKHLLKESAKSVLGTILRF